LRQLSVHPQIYINAKRREDSTYERDDWSASTTKFDRIKTIIKNDNNKEVHKYIIFCQFMEEMHLLRDELSSFVPHVLLYNGSMQQQARDEVLAFSKTTTETTVLLLQLQAGGVGLNLQEYDRIIFVSPWWTSALMDQAIARAVRMGQKKIVKVYHLKLAMEASNEKIINIDEMVQKKAEEKREMLKRIFTFCAEKTRGIAKIKPIAA
jgi:SNF2 family DNA or RNA helicase